MYAAAFGHREIVLLILAAFRQLHHVAFQGQRNGQGLTAWQLAERNGHEDVAALLKVETGVFPRPSGPSAFVPAHPLDLDRPPTPTETRSVRPSCRRAKSLGRSTALATGPGPTDPLPPPSQIYCSDCHRGLASSRRRSSRGESEGSFRREKGRGPCACSRDQNSDDEDCVDWEEGDTGGTREVDTTRRLSLGASGVNTNIKGVIGLTSGSANQGPTGLNSGLINKGSIRSNSGLINKGVTGSNSSLINKGATGSSSGLINKGVTGPNSSLINKGATGASSGLLNKGATPLSGGKVARVTSNIFSLKDTSDSPSSSVTKTTTDDDLVHNTTVTRVERGGVVRNIIGWTRDTGNRRSEGGEASERSRARSEPVRVGAPDTDERRVLEELMQGLSVAGSSPGSGNEADTESLMECEHSAVEEDEDKVDVMMSGSNARKLTVSGVTITAAQPMPKIELSSSTRSLNRSIQHLVQEDAENRPEHRPPTPARPSLPTLLPGRLLDVSFSASVGSTKSEGRGSVVPSRKVTFTSFPRSSSEPRSLTASPRPDDDDDDGEEESSTDLLDSSTRSEGWDHLRGTRGRGPTFTSTEGHVVPLPPINRPRYAEGSRGRGGVRGRSGMTAGCEENVLNVAKKTLEQLETVLAPKETPALPRTIPRTRTSHQIHLET